MPLLGTDFADVLAGRRQSREGFDVAPGHEKGGSQAAP